MLLKIKKKQWIKFTIVGENVVTKIISWISKNRHGTRKITKNRVENG